MDDIPEDELEETRAALASTLDATAAILPLLAKPRQARFDKKLNDDWIAGTKRLSAAWAGRHGGSPEDLRPAIFSLYSLALQTGDADCLRLGEALAGAADRLEEASPPKLVAALTAAIECLDEPAGLEHEAFAERARHFAQRLETAVQPETTERSPVLDRLFVSEAQELLEAMQDALAALPPDAVALREDARQLAHQAEQLALWGIMHLARQLTDEIAAHAMELDLPEVHDRLQTHLDNLSISVAAVDQ